MSGASTPSPDRRGLGAAGEAIAATYLADLGMQIVARNWRCTLGEIDLVAREGDQIVFVEVRTRRGTAPPTESITVTKQQRMRLTAFTYLNTHNLLNVDWRIDVIAITMPRDNTAPLIEHLPYAVGE